MHWISHTVEESTKTATNFVDDDKCGTNHSCACNTLQHTATHGRGATTATLINYECGMTHFYANKLYRQLQLITL